jgi:hypothetical protein
MRYKFTPIELRLDGFDHDGVICVQWDGLYGKWHVVGDYGYLGPYDTQAEAEDAALKLAKELTDEKV